MSVYMTPASVTASLGSLVAVICAPVCLAIFSALSITSIFGSIPSGVAYLTSCPNETPANNKSCSTLFPSPTHDMCPFMSFLFSVITIKSAAA